MRRVSFTIRSSKTDFEAALKEPRVSILGVAWEDFLRAVEPFCAGAASSLYALGELDNLDKHRDLVLLETKGDTFKWDERTSTYAPVARGLSVEQGVAIQLDPSQASYHTHTQTRFVIAEDIPGHDREEWAHVVLGQEADLVLAILDKAKADVSLWP
jgi:hypothetical protein